MEISCKFFTSQDNSYQCNISHQNIPESSDFTLSGQHETLKNSSHVTAVTFMHCKIKKFPQNLIKIFDNLKSLTKKLSKFDLIEYKNLEQLDFSFNQLEFLPGDLLDGFTKLKSLSFYANNLTTIEPNILDSLAGLETVDFRANQNFDMCYSEKNTDWSFQTLDEVKNLLFEKFEIPGIYGVGDLIRRLIKENSEERKAKEELESCRLNFEVQIKDLNDQLREARNSNIKTFVQNDQNFKDFHIKIGDREFHVHKVLLAAQSPTLAGMLLENPEGQCLTLSDFSADVFEHIVKFIYTDELPSGPRKGPCGSRGASGFLDSFEGGFRTSMDYNRTPGIDEYSSGSTNFHHSHAKVLSQVKPTQKFFSFDFRHELKFPCGSGTKKPEIPVQGTKINFLDLFAAASFLKIEILRNHAAGNILEETNAENALQVLKMANKYEHDGLRQKSFNEIKKKYPKINFESHWAEDGDKMAEILELLKKKQETEYKLDEKFNSLFYK